MKEKVKVNIQIKAVLRDGEHTIYTCSKYCPHRSDIKEPRVKSLFSTETIFCSLFGEYSHACWNGKTWLPLVASLCREVLMKEKKPLVVAKLEKALRRSSLLRVALRKH